MLKRPRTPPTNSLSMDYQTADSESVLKRPRPFGISDGVITNAYAIFLAQVLIPNIFEAHSFF